MGQLVYSAIMPHPPILVPEVGKNNLKAVEKTRQACEKVSFLIKDLKADTIIIFTPHGMAGQVSVPVCSGTAFEGSFINFGCAKPVLNFKGDPDLAQAILKATDRATRCSETLLDHGSLVPLYYVQSAGSKAKILPIAISLLPYVELFKFGKIVADVIAASDKKVAVIASADMSHRLTSDAPAGYSPRGKEFDEKLVQLVAENNKDGIINFDHLLAEEAGQDALWSIAMLLGAVDSLAVKPHILSYESPFGVGYMVAEYK
jgi:AmmeMemoRadiSam system protein B